MTADISDIIKKNKGDGSEEMGAFYQVVCGLAELYSFPSNKLTKVKDANNRVVGYAFDFANPWYVAEPVSAIQNIALKINGDEIKHGDISIILRGQKIPVEVAKTFYELRWGFGEIAQIFFENRSIKNESLRAENELEMQLDMRTTINYGIPQNHVKYVLKRKMEVQ